MAEAMRLRWSLLWAMEQNLINVEIEMDVGQVVKCVNGLLHLAEIEFIVVDCLDLMSRLDSIRVVCVKRSGNLIAHSLVGLARTLGCKSWLGSVPNQIYHAYCNEIVVF